ncbi:DEAD/DEAH box helicase, partial [Leptospira bourretii]|uniref:restriction endonuclease n=1 Tax=Leptospira bourretii TaxID=2484962 RepID=UPI0010914952
MKESLKTDIHTPLLSILYKFREAAKSEREKGTYFEELVLLYFRNEPYYKDYYSDVWMYSDWAKLEGKDARDVGIDLVAKTRTTNEIHAIQSKFYDANYKIQKADIDSFFTASGQKPFVKRIIISTTNLWSEHADGALHNQTPPVTKIDLSDLENSVIDWNKFKSKEVVPLREQKKLRDHQKEALLGVTRGLQTADRGKLIMACGTGKTFTSLKIAEEMAGKGKRVLFLVPSLSLLSQSLTEWTQESAIELHSYAVCSDSEVGKKRDKNEDVVETIETNLKYPATTDAKRLAEEVGKRHDQSHMTVVFSTYHSIQVISDAQKKHKMEAFDLVICDEAHRTTGATFESEDESHFVKVHDNSFLKATKRLYMTATPRIYGDTAKVSAEKDNVTLCSMDDEKLFGKELYVINFSTAVSRGLLVDYKVIVLAVDENHVNARLQKLLADENNQIKVDDAAKIIGCWKALSKQGSRETIPGLESPMKRAVAFCQVIEIQKGAKTHKVSSKLIAEMFANVIAAYQEKEEDPHPLLCEAEHVDGGMNAGEKEAKLQWLKEPTPDNVCRILSNVRCLS